MDTDAALDSVAVFNCTADSSNIVVFWNVTTTAGTPYIFQQDEHASEGLEASKLDSSKSTLKILATAEFEQAAISCLASYTHLDEPVVSETAFLTVKGIGTVENLTSDLNPPSLVLSWNQPKYVSQDVDALLYKVSAIGEDLAVVLQQDTSLTSYSTSYSNIEPCHHYNFSVQAFSKEYESERSTLELYLYAGLQDTP